MDAQPGITECREPLVAWNGVIVDGHNRYRICREHHIPFYITEIDFANQGEAIAWIIKNQIGRRNLSPFQRYEMVLPYEAELKADAKMRQGWRSDLKRCDPNRGRCTADVLADMAAVSHGTLSKVKTILATGGSETLRRVRKGEISIHFAYSSLVSKPSSPIDMNPSQGSDPDGVIHFAPVVLVENTPLFDAAFSTLEMFAENGATKNTVIRGFGSV